MTYSGNPEESSEETQRNQHPEPEAPAPRREDAAKSSTDVLKGLQPPAEVPVTDSESADISSEDARKRQQRAPEVRVAVNQVGVGSGTGAPKGQRPPAEVPVNDGESADRPSKNALGGQRPAQEGLVPQREGGDEKNIKAHSPEGSFNWWLRGKQEKLEKTAGAVVLATEIVALLASIFLTPEIIVTKVMNLLFLAFTYFQLRKQFALPPVTVSSAGRELVASILRLEDRRNKEMSVAMTLDALILCSNKLIRQLRNINYFILSTAVLYCFLILQGNGASNRRVFHFLVDFTSYVGAFYLLRSFFVMYLPTVEKDGREILNERTYPWACVGLALMVADVCLTINSPRPDNVMFIMEFVCGVVNGVVLVSFIARFETRILDIPSYVLFVLYAYAVLQTCLPLVDTKQAAALVPEIFISVAFEMLLIGKVGLVAVLFYLLSTRRIFYYFMIMRSAYEEERILGDWQKFKEVTVAGPSGPESFDLRRLSQPYRAANSSLRSRCHWLFSPRSCWARPFC